MDFSEFVAENGSRREIEAGEHVFRQGQSDESIYFVQKGLLKAYYLSADGKETIKSFIQAGELIGSLTSAYSKGECSFNLIAMDSTELLELPFERIYETCRRDLEFSRIVVDALLAFAMKKERREREFLSDSAETRYRTLVEESPALLKHVRQKDIARFLGITPVALSRIRARLLKIGKNHGSDSR
ncbi:MAG: Crp/Fnr family transcriptional regulator [Gammaproteobacteria bacterium]